MKLQESSKQQIKKVSFFCLAGDAIFIIVFSLLGKFSLKLIYSVLLGSLVAIAGFVWLCYSVEQYIEKSSAEKHASLTPSYVGRMILYGGWVVLCAKLDFLDTLPGIIPVFFPGIAIKILSVIENKNKKEVGE